MTADSGSGPGALLDLILLTATAALGARGGLVAAWDDDRARLDVLAHRGLEDSTVDTLSRSLERSLRKTDAPARDPIPVGASGAASDRSGRVLAAPLGGPPPDRPPRDPPDPGERPDAAPRGFIALVRDTATPDASPRDRQLLELFARQAAAAFAQTRLTGATVAERDRLEALQSSFVSIVSHELQTPVAIIKAYAGTLARRDAPWNQETVNRVAHTIEEECDRLHRLITDLLDLSRIQAGRVAMSIGPVDLADLAETVAERNRTRAPEHQISTDFPPDFPIVRGDLEKLRQALGNLVDNAIKYSPGGGPIVIAGRAAPDHVLLSVSDRGIGIPPEERAHVFERFHRVDTRLTRTTRGVGLGLYICKVIVEAHGGKIWAESSGPGTGSAFVIRLPR